jgi:hypothetical protein
MRRRVARWFNECVETKKHAKLQFTTAKRKRAKAKLTVLFTFPLMKKRPTIAPMDTNLLHF